nr:hypothetical protein [Tanacetum cinerariifolium]
MNCASKALGFTQTTHSLTSSTSMTYEEKLLSAMDKMVNNHRKRDLRTDHPDAYNWIEANRQWLYDNFDHCEVETSDNDDDAWSLWSLDDDEHFDLFEDDLTYPDARWSS